jgi:hypothetical protein
MMDELFSCRNCIHNPGQSLLIGPRSGFCLQHDSVIWEPERTTCKYLHRKDLPSFVVDEGTREHAAEFAGFPLLVSFDRKESIDPIRYSEKLRWEKSTFDPIVHIVAQYYKVEPRWILISALSGGVDGRRSLAHSSLVRHYMDRCGTWKSSYRLVLGLLEEIDIQPQFGPRELVHAGGISQAEAAEDATWDVFFARLAALQEYGWHAGLEALMWASDSLNGGMTDLNWSHLQTELTNRRQAWIELIIASARQHDEFFPPHDANARITQEIEG